MIIPITIKIMIIIAMTKMIIRIIRKIGYSYKILFRLHLSSMINAWCMVICIVWLEDPMIGYCCHAISLLVTGRNSVFRENVFLFRRYKSRITSKNSLTTTPWLKSKTSKFAQCTIRNTIPIWVHEVSLITTRSKEWHNFEGGRRVCGV